MTTDQTKHIDRIKAACRKVLELDKAATPGNWKSALRNDPQYWIEAPGQSPSIVANTVGGNDEANAAFIAFAKSFTAPVAQAMLVSIEHWEKLYSETKSYADSSIGANIHAKLCNEFAAVCLSALDAIIAIFPPEALQ